MVGSVSTVFTTCSQQTNLHKEWNCCAQVLLPAPHSTCNLPLPETSLGPKGWPNSQEFMKFPVCLKTQEALNYLKLVRFSNRALKILGLYPLRHTHHLFHQWLPWKARQNVAPQRMTRHLVLPWQKVWRPWIFRFGGGIGNLGHLNYPHLVVKEETNSLAEYD